MPIRRPRGDGKGISVEKISETIIEIRKALNEAARIVQAISEITQQTKQLPLNGTVETVTTGEAPASSTTPADDHHDNTVQAAQAFQNTAAMMEEATKTAQEGMAIAAEVERIVDEITASARKAKALAAEIAAASAKIEPAAPELDDTG